MNGLFRLAGNIISTSVGFLPRLGGIAPGEHENEVATIGQTLLLSGDQSASGVKTFSNGILTDSVKAINEPITAGSNVVSESYGDGRNYTTVLTLTDVSFAVAAEADEAIGAITATFPNGAHSLSVSYMNISLQGGGVVDADTPDVGLGTVEATGAVSVLGGTASFEDIIDGQTATDCDGTATTALLKPDNELSTSEDAKTVYLNIAASWSGEDTVLASGTIVLKWTIMS